MHWEQLKGHFLPSCRFLGQNLKKNSLNFTKICKNCHFLVLLAMFGPKISRLLRKMAKLPLKQREKGRDSNFWLYCCFRQIPFIVKKSQTLLSFLNCNAFYGQSFKLLYGIVQFQNIKFFSKILRKCLKLLSNYSKFTKKSIPSNF